MELDNFDPLQAFTTMLAFVFGYTSMISTGIETELAQIVNTQLFTAGGQTIVLAPLISLFTLALAYGLNDKDFKEFGDVQTGATVLGFLLVLAVAVVPAIAAVVTESPVIGGVVFVLEGASFSFIAGFWNDMW